MGPGVFADAAVKKSSLPPNEIEPRTSSLLLVTLVTQYPDLRITYCDEVPERGMEE
jgi:hypothetical protein